MTKKKEIRIYIDSGQIKMIDRIIESGYTNSRSELVRRIIDRYLFDYYQIIKHFEILTPEQIKLLGD